MSHGTIPRLLTMLLKDNATIAEAVGSRIHYQTIPQSSQYPHVYITRQGKDTDSLIDGSNGVSEERYIVEIVAKSMLDELCTVVTETLQFDGFNFEGIQIFMSDLTDVSDDYVFQTANGNGLLVHGFVLTVYLCESN